MNAGRERTEGRAATPLEWVLGGLSALLSAATIAFLIREGAVQPAGAVPELVAEVDTVVAAEAGWVVEVRVHNRGHATAAAVQVRGVLEADTGTAETSELTLDYVPERSHREGGLVFTRDPARYRLDVRATGYARP